MSHHTKLDENLEGADNFRAWKYRISLVLEENELDSYINEEIPILEGDEAKALHKKKLVMAMRINRELSTPYNTQQNGIAERKNRTIMEAVRAMLHDQDIPMHLCAKAARIAVYVQTILHTEYSRTRHLKKSSPARNQKSTIPEYSVVLYTYTF